MLTQLQSKNFLVNIGQKAILNQTTRAPLQPKNMDKLDASSNIILPQIDNSRVAKRQNNNSFNDMNISMDINLQPREDIPKENRNNFSFDVERAKAYNNILGGLDGNKIKTDFTKRFIYMYRDEGISAGTREKIRENLEEDKKKILRQRLEEIKKRKDQIIMKIAENQKEMIEKEKFIEKMRKIANDAATKIQKNWRRHIMKQRTLRGIVLAKIIEHQYRIVKFAKDKLSIFSTLLLNHKLKIEKVNLFDSY